MKRILMVAGLAWGLVCADPAISQDGGQESVDDLLKRLDQAQVEGEGAVTAPPTSVLPALDFAPLQLRAPPAIHLYRAADPVQVVHQGILRRLQYWDSHFQLDAGDEVRMGPKSRAVVDFPDGANLVFDGPALLRIESGVEESPRKLAIPTVGPFLGVQLYEVPTAIELPGGHRLIGVTTQLSLRLRDLKELIVRNSGPGSVDLEGPYLPSGKIALLGGQEVILALFPLSGVGPTGEVREVVLDSEGTSGGRVPSMKVQAPTEIAVDEEGQSLVLRGRGTTPGVAHVSGTRVVLPPGEAIRVRRASLGVRRDEER